MIHGDLRGENLSKQTEDYIKLKPIADRFKEVGMSISDDEIKAIIKEELREQIRNQVEFGTVINEWTEIWLEDENNCEFVMRCIKDSIQNKFR